MALLPLPSSYPPDLVEYLLRRHAQILAVRGQTALDPVAAVAGAATPGTGSADLETIRSSLFFDPDWYLGTYPDVAAAGLDPADHYLDAGAAEGRDPCPWFSTRQYLTDHPDVAAAGLHPLVHFERHGRTEGRAVPWSAGRSASATAMSRPAVAAVDDALSIIARSLFFDAEWYLDTYPDVRRVGLDPARHYYEWGAAEGRDPGPSFSTRGYLEDNGDVAATGINALVHFERHGRREGRRLPWPGGAGVGGRKASHGRAGCLATTGAAGGPPVRAPVAAPVGTARHGVVRGTPLVSRPRPGFHPDAPNHHRRTAHTNGPVDVFLAGVQKGGTSTLYEYLRTHPGLNAPREKELHFFDDEARRWQSPNYDDLHGCFAAGLPERLCFDATPSYCFWAPALDRIWRYNPGARFILLCRDPVARAISHWRMERSYGYEPFSFGEAVRAEPERLAATPPWSWDWREMSYVARGRYGECLARLLSRFPRSQVLLLRSEDLFRDHQAVLAQVAAFLNLAPFGPQPPVHAFAGANQEPVAPADADYVRQLLRDDMACFAALSGLDIRAWLEPPASMA